MTFCGLDVKVSPEVDQDDILWFGCQKVSPGMDQYDIL